MCIRNSVTFGRPAGRPGRHFRRPCPEENWVSTTWFRTIWTTCFDDLPAAGENFVMIFYHNVIGNENLMFGYQWKYDYLHRSSTRPSDFINFYSIPSTPKSGRPTDPVHWTGHPADCVLKSGRPADLVHWNQVVLATVSAEISPTDRVHENHVRPGPNQPTSSAEIRSSCRPRLLKSDCPHPLKSGRQLVLPSRYWSQVVLPVSSIEVRSSCRPHPLNQVGRRPDFSGRDRMII